MQVDVNIINELTDAESELYDRQIRLWGLESQKRLKTAKILIAGMNGLGAEITKNLILAGVQSVKLLDDQYVSKDDYCSQFLINHLALGRNRAEASIESAKLLNPMVDITADSESLSKKSAKYFDEFDVVIICGAQIAELQRINQLCRENVKFFSGDVWGTFGYHFADLGTHEFIEDIIKYKVISKPNEKLKTEPFISSVKKELKYPPFSSLIEFDVLKSSYQKRMKRVGPALMILKSIQAFREKFKRDPLRKTREADIIELQKIYHELFGSKLPEPYFEEIFGQISPAVAIVGGVIAQEVIKVITKKEAPHYNVFLFDSQLSCGFIENLQMY